MKVIYSWRQPKLTAPNRKKIKSLINRVVQLANMELSGESILSVIFPGPKTMRKLNRDFLNHDYLTDVICFHYDNSDLEEDVAVEIFVSPDIAKIREKEINGTTYSYEIILYIVHGILHASGELDATNEQKRAIRKKETDIINRLANEFNFHEIFPD